MFASKGIRGGGRKEERDEGEDCMTGKKEEKLGWDKQEVLHGAGRIKGVKK